MSQPFISWSGEMSRVAAGLLRDWLPLVIPGCQPWVSSHDIRPGARWSQELADALASAKLAVIVLTRENVGSPWLLFEAGALSLSTSGKVIPLLLDMPVDALPAPISQFQSCPADKQGIFRLVQTVASVMTPPPAVASMRRSFAKVWPQLEAAISAFPSSAARFGAPTLTGAEVRVLRALIAGIAPSEIAKNEDVAISTVRTHISTIRSKTGARSAQDLLSRVAVLPAIQAKLR